MLQNNEATRKARMGCLRGTEPMCRFGSLGPGEVASTSNDPNDRALAVCLFVRPSSVETGMICKKA